MPALLGNMKRPEPVTSCTNCGGPGFIIELTDANCGRMVSGKRCFGTNRRAIGDSWKECLTCAAFGYVGAAQCSVCDGFGWALRALKLSHLMSDLRRSYDCRSIHGDPKISIW